MKFTRSSFTGGMNASYERTKSADASYPVGLNCRVRKNVVEGAFKPVRKQTPSGLHQAIFTLDDTLLAVVAGVVYKIDPDNGGSYGLSSQVLSSTVDVVYHENVPAPTSFFMVNADGNLTYNSKVATQPECVVLQDGVTQPPLVTPDLGVRSTKTYAEWSYDQPEYVPIGLQMCHSGRVLYVVAPDGRTIYRSVSGRPLDFVVAIDDATGDKRGNAASTSLAVATSKLTALIAAQTGGFLAFTYSAAYGGTINTSVEDDFGEPVIEPSQLFPVGAVGQYGFASANGETVFVTSSGIVSFNQVSQAMRESNNSALGAPISEYLIRPIESVACISADDYVFFAVSTIFGDGILVYDTQLNTFVSIDLVGKVKEFALLKGRGVDRLFFITTSDELFELPLYEGERSSFSLILTYATQNPAVRMRPVFVSAAFVNVLTTGVATLLTYVDNKFVTAQSLSLTADQESALLSYQTPVAAIVGKSAKAEVLGFDISEAPLGYSVTYELTCTANAQLAVMVADCPESEQIQPPSTEFSPEIFRAIGFIRPDNTYTTPFETDVNKLLVLHSADQSWVVNGGDRVTALANQAKRFRARTTKLTCSPTAKVYDYSTLEILLNLRPAGSDGLFLLGDVGGGPHFAHVFSVAKMFGDPVHAVLGMTDQDTEAENADFTAKAGKPIRYRESTAYADFYCMSIPLPTANAAVDANGVLIGTTPDEMKEDGMFARWLSSSIASRGPSHIPVVVLGYPPYSDCDTFKPGFAALRWNFKRMGVKLVLAGGRSYERHYVDGVVYINVGTGAPLATLESAGLSIPGILELMSYPGKLDLVFKDYLGYERDRTTILA